MRPVRSIFMLSFPEPFPIPDETAGRPPRLACQPVRASALAELPRLDTFFPPRSFSCAALTSLLTPVGHHSFVMPLSDPIPRDASCTGTDEDRSGSADAGLAEAVDDSASPRL